MKASKILYYLLSWRMGGDMNKFLAEALGISVAELEAAQALAAVEKLIFEERSVDPEELVDALNANYEGYKPLSRRLVEEGLKVGNNDDDADRLLITTIGDIPFGIVMLVAPGWRQLLLTERRVIAVGY
jgi:hypothetical protein